MRPEQGTWLGMTRDGRIAVLTNFREDGVIPSEAKSRGAMVTAFLTRSLEGEQGTEALVKSLVEDGLIGMGGFSLICGRVGLPLAAISNRTPNIEGITWILEHFETVGLSNAAIADRTWTKVTRGEMLLKEAIEAHANSKASKETLLGDLFEILDDDTLPRHETKHDWESQVKELRESIFVPALGGQPVSEQSAEDLAAARSERTVSTGVQQEQRSASSDTRGAYGTQKQTIILVSLAGKVTFVERTLYDTNGRPTEGGARDRYFEFEIS